MTISGLLSYLTFFLVNAGIFAIVCLGLNIQWGYTGLFNVGVAGFYCIGAYASALFTLAPPPSEEVAQYTTSVFSLNMPFGFGLLFAMILSGIVALGVGALTLKLKGDYLAIATIGIAETIRLIFLNEKGLANGSSGISNICRPLEDLIPGANYEYFYLCIVVLILMLLFLLIERSIRSPWGRVLRGIREDEVSAAMSGKNIVSFKMQSFVFGSMIIGLAGALKVHFLKTVTPQMFIPLEATFIPWIMLILGGSGNNRGAILGAMIVWGLMTFSQLLTDLNLLVITLCLLPLIVLKILDKKKNPFYTAGLLWGILTFVARLFTELTMFNTLVYKIFNGLSKVLTGHGLNYDLMNTLASRTPYFRYLGIGIILIIILVNRPSGILGEEKTVSRHA